MTQVKQTWRPVRLALMGFGLALLYGCQSSTILAPVALEEEALTVEVFAPSATPPASGSDSWYTVAEKEVRPGRHTVVNGSRYTLVFDGDEVSQPVMVTLRERDPDIVDVDLGPDGFNFNAPVTLTINYNNTIHDPSDPGYSGDAPTVYLLGQKRWIPMPGTSKQGASPFHEVELEHFSRYRMLDGTGEKIVFGDRSEQGKNKHTFEFTDPGLEISEGKD